MARSEIRETLALVGDLRELATQGKLGETEREVATKQRLLKIAAEISACLARFEERQAPAAARAVNADPETREIRLTALGRVTAEVGYQLNNLLALASTRLELIDISLRAGDREKALANSALAREYLRQVEVLALRLTDFSEQPVQSMRSDLNRIVRNTVSFVRLLAPYENIEFETNLGGDLPAVFLDPPRWHQLLLSLFANAADAVGRRKGEGGRIRVSTAVDPSTGRIVLRVRDEGRGIAPQDLPRLFEPGFTTKGAGREGLGLTTCRRIVEEAGGTIALASEPGRGTTVTITLPAVR
ncbi:MAG: hypothetical protein FJY73_12400 [Candidatus Eisenbacteria bacterium]|nr:hypothetical protein [Candidatus Eisenbacteria bacterium]